VLETNSLSQRRQYAEAACLQRCLTILVPDAQHLKYSVLDLSFGLLHDRCDFHVGC